MRVELMFPSKYIRAVDLQGRDVVVAIDKVQMEDLPLKGTGKTERKPVLYMRRRSGEPIEKALVLNKTNATAIAKLHGWEADEWPGKPIALFPTQDKFGRDMVDCIRVRPTVPSQPREREPGEEG